MSPETLPQKPRIAVMGSGAVGAYYGGRLAQHGHDVHFLLRSDYAAVREKGWNIRSCDGDFFLPPDRLHVYREPTEMPPVDLVLVTLKTTGNDAFERLIRPILSETTCILTIQNGLGNEDRLAELFGRERIVGGVAFVCINRIAPGIVHHSDHGLVRIGEFASGDGRSARTELIANLFQASGIRCQVTDDLLRTRWEKLIWNIPFNGLGAVLDWTTDRLIATEKGRSLVTGLMREVIAAARADGVHLDEPAKSLQKENSARPEEAIQQIISRQIEQTRTMGAYQSSMQVDRRMGRPMEVESILGHPLQRARRAGIDTPMLASLYKLASLVAETVRADI